MCMVHTYPDISYISVCTAYTLLAYGAPKEGKGEEKPEKREAV